MRFYLFGMALLPIAIAGLLADEKKPVAPDVKQVDLLIKQLGSKSFDEREAAVKALTAIGAPALKRLKDALNDSDLEIRRRAQSCIQTIERALPIQVPEGVTVITLPPGEFCLLFVPSKPHPKLRLTMDKLVIEGPRFYFGDGRIATLHEAQADGLHWVGYSGNPDFVMTGSITWTPGGTDGLGINYLRVDELKAGSVYVITPSRNYSYDEKKKK